MANINLTDSRKRDAVVKAESIRVYGGVRYIGPKGGNAYIRKVLKSTVDHDYKTLLENHGEGDPEKLAEAMVKGDPEIDIERFGLYLWNLSRVYLNPDEEMVYRIEQFDIVRTPDGTVKERRPRERDEANVDGDIPLTWSGKMIKKSEAIRRYVFRSKLQIVHVNGLTYDFLYNMAKELAETDSLMLMGGGKKGKEPLVFRRGSTPYRGFLEGRIDGKRYILLLHLSNAELKLPPEISANTGNKEPTTPAKKESKESVKKPARKTKSKSAKKKSKTKTKKKSSGAKKK
ncbi:MAG: hypothetical protein V3U84_09160 [Thiotrichaceae bacterium]